MRGGMAWRTGLGLGLGLGLGDCEVAYRRRVAGLLRALAGRVVRLD